MGMRKARITKGDHVRLIDTGHTGRVKIIESLPGGVGVDIRLDPGQGFPKSKARYTRIENLRLIEEES